jgi:phage terminase Nu1 subunit (DNA packaging protein)
MAERIANRSEMARLLEVSEPTFDRFMDRGMPILQRGSTGKPYQFDVEAVITWYRGEIERDEAAAAARAADLTQLSMELNGGAAAEIEGVAPGLSGKARIEALQGALLQDKLEQQRGKLIPVEDVRADYTALFSRLRQRLLSLPVMLVRSAGLTPSQAATVDADVRALLRELALQIADPDMRPEAPEELH